MSDLNKAFLEGNLVEEPRVAYTATGQAVCNFRMANNKSKKEADGTWGNVPVFLSCTAWGKTAERMGHLPKGKKLFVAGEIRSNTYDTRDGKKKTEIFLNCQTVMTVELPKKLHNYSQGPLIENQKTPSEDYEEYPAPADWEEDGSPF